MHQIRFRLGFRPRPRWGSLQRSPDLLDLRGSTSKGREGKRRGERGREEEGRGSSPLKLDTLASPLGSIKLKHTCYYK